MSEQPAPSKFQIRLPLLLALTLAAGMFIGQQLPRTNAHVQSSTGSHGNTSSVLDEIMQFVNARYVDTVDVNSIKEKAIKSLLDELDPHSVYISPEEAQVVEDDMNGSFVGIGVEFLMLDDTIQVVTPMPGGPSESVGIMPGDKIISINDTTVAGVHIETSKIYKKLRGEKGSEVRLGIRRGKETTQRNFTVIRDNIPVKSVETAYMLDEKTGYIKINRFTAKTYNEFMEALRPMAEEQGMSNLTIDLRGNPGGYLEEATQMLSQFFPEGKLLVYTEGRSDNRQEYKSNGRARFNIQNIAVLIDEGSASASEILAGAIQDHDRGWVIGRRSYGKGLVQEEYPLSNQGRLRLTVARYFTPSGRCIQRVYKNNKNYAKEEMLRLNNGELTDSTKVKVSDSTAFYTGMGRVVYAGGGITPDVFIPLDTTYFNAFFDQLNHNLPQFLSRWMDENGRNALPATEDEFVKTYKVTDQTVEALAQYTVKQGATYNAAQLAKCKNELKLRLKARIARLLFGNKAEYRVINNDDPAIAKALQVMKSGTPVAQK